ncbi:MAG: hypothetical protein FWG41_05580 [Methanomassiliicoccaceae archaeon]|nr:hypothetical protein [Methanomassiliicoccaceae archaeon]
MKTITLLIVFLVIVTSMAAVAIVALSLQDSQDNDQMNPPEPLNSEMEMKIKQDYFNQITKIKFPEATIDNVGINKYYGTYNGSVVVKMSDLTGHLIMMISETVGGITINYPDTNKALVWKDGNFYSMQEAYDLGLLCKDDLREISRL